MYRIYEQITKPLKETSNELKCKRVANFFRVIPNLERFLFLTYLVCLDNFLFHFLIIPLRALHSLISFKPRKEDCLHFLVLLIGVSFLILMDASRLYHMIRGQSALKLYVIFNVFEVADKLLGSFGLDVLDIYNSDNSSNNNSDGLHPVMHFFVACGYTIVHSIVLLYQMLTLNVAVNSFSHALLTLLVSNQFVEIKSAVFKKFDPDSLAQLAGADGVERLQLSLYILMVALRDWTEGSIAWARLLPSLLSIYASEFVVDWLKHAFISKFNNLSPMLYTQCAQKLESDLVDSDLCATNRLARRAGFCALPLCCVFLKTLFACKPLYTVMFFLLAFMLKVITGHALSKRNKKIE